MLFSFYDAVDWGSARLNDGLSFLRSIPSFFAPKPSTSGAPYTPPFTGGQCQGVKYRFEVDSRAGSVPQTSTWRNITGAIGSPVFSYNDGISDNWNIPTGQGAIGVRSSIRPTIYNVAREDLANDNCGNIPNPVPNPSINDDGLFTPNNPVIGDENGTLNPAAIVLSPAAPLILIGGGLAAAAAAAAAAQAASDALAAIKKVAESLDALKKLWEKLQEFLEEWEKDRPKNRDIVRQTYGSIEGDGAIDFYPLSNKNFTAIQVDIVVTEVPLGFGKYFGSMSPSRYRYKELGYISFYSINKGIIETHSIQFKRSSLVIPKTAVGFIYHFGLDNKIKGFAFGTFSVRKS